MSNKRSKVNIYKNPQNQFALQQLVLTLKDCALIRNLFLFAIQLIAEYGLGSVELCECQEEELLILPSMGPFFVRFNCTDCCIGSSCTLQCDICISKRNYFTSEEIYSSLEFHPAPACSYCDNHLPICPQCRFICKGCGTQCCKKNHLHSICSRCNAEYCIGCEMIIFECNNCNEQMCSFETKIVCQFLGQLQLVDCGYLYNICTICFSSTIANIYPSEICYTSCTNIQRVLLEYLNNNNILISDKVIELIAIFANECQGENCLDCQWMFQ